MMILLKRHSSPNRKPVFTWLLLLSGVACLLLSCGGDDNKEETTDPAVQQSLDKAKSAMGKIGVPISFESVEPLGNVQQFADPLELGALEDVAAIDVAIGALNDALNAGGFSSAAAAPTAFQQRENKKLETIIHLNLAYLYMLSAVSRCMIDGGDVYTIEVGDNLDTPEIEFYRLELKLVGAERLAQVKAMENPRAADFLNIFAQNQRQAIINALNLMNQVEASVEAIPEAGIEGQAPDYNRAVSRYSSLYHWQHANGVAPLVGTREIEVTNLIGMVATRFFESIKKKAQNWQFKIEERK